MAPDAQAGRCSGHARAQSWVTTGPKKSHNPRVQLRPLSVIQLRLGRQKEEQAYKQERGEISVNKHNNGEKHNSQFSFSVSL